MMDLAFILLISTSPVVPIEQKAAVEELSVTSTNRYYKPKQASITSCPIGCLCDQGEAMATSWSRGVPIVFWVGMTPGDSPIIRAEMPDAVHCFLATNNGNDTPRLLICRPGDTSNSAVWKASEFDDASPSLIAKQLMRLTRPIAMVQQVLPVTQIQYTNRYPMTLPAMTGSSGVA
jgi:hypothetical protein